MKELRVSKVSFDDKRLSQDVYDYVFSRQNSDGGYTFVQENDSNAQDTYYGVAILKLLGVQFPNADRTRQWLHSFKLGSVYTYYYVAKALSICGEDLSSRFKEYLRSMLASKRYFGSVDVYLEVASEFQITTMVLELAELLGQKETRKEVVDWLLKYKNSDGGFGSYGYSNVNSTYYATASLGLLGFNLDKIKDTVDFLRACENPEGGFTVVPNSYAPYMEHTFYGVSALEALKERCNYPSRTIDFVLKCQNANGGFARTDIGISTFENTFQAISLIRKLA